MSPQSEQRAKPPSAVELWGATIEAINRLPYQQRFLPARGLRYWGYDDGERLVLVLHGPRTLSVWYGEAPRA